jgi:hypothetical protein
MSANSFGQKRTEHWWHCASEEALEILQKGKGLCDVSGAKDPGLCVLAACAAWPVRKEAFCQQALWLLWRSKVTAHPRRLSGTNIH